MTEFHSINIYPIHEMYINSALLLGIYFDDFLQCLRGKIKLVVITFAYLLKFSILCVYIIWKAWP